MSLLDGLIVVLGLAVFEIIVSIDNAIINAHVLKNMGQKWRKLFLVFGILTAVLLMRLILPLVMVWLLVPDISADGITKLFTSDNSLAHEAIENQKYLILSFGGMFLLLVYFHWLFMEKKNPLFVHEKFLKENHDVWFFAFAALLLATVLYFARSNPKMMITAALGNAAFFILYGFKESAEKQEKTMIKTEAPDISKFMYLEVLDMVFSFDSVIGAFAFTTNMLYIFIGLGIGALALRELTLLGIGKISRYIWLKNGAMTSIAFLGVFMMMESFGVSLPKILPTFITLCVIGYAFFMSHKNNKKN